jgi:hypothetical protein
MNDLDDFYKVPKDPFSMIPYSGSLIRPSYGQVGRWFGWAYKGAYHRLKGPAYSEKRASGEVVRIFYILGNRTKNEEEFLNKAWRRKIFLYYMQHPFTGGQM